VAYQNDDSIGGRGVGMTVAELVILGGILVGLLWLLRPLQRLVRNVIERWLLRSRHGKVIEGRFKVVPKDEPPDDDQPAGGPH
jgi:hypothetical protein